MNKVEQIRRSEKAYHDYLYEKYKLFEKGSWLNKPVKTVMEQLSNFEGKDDLRVLDLGAGVGRNSIPIAQTMKSGEVVCVDLLDSAIEKLVQYSKQFGVDSIIRPIKSDLCAYPIEPNRFDLIIAVSSLEHLATEVDLNRVLKQMAEGTKIDGINCMIINSDMQEILLEKNEPLEVFMELNLSTETVMSKLDQVYADGWEKIQTHVKPLDYKITRDNKPVLLKTNAVTYVVRKQK